MQKKLLAMVATLTIVLSMFSGITFAAAAQYKILLDTTTVVSGGPTDVGVDWFQGVITRNNAHDGRDYKIRLIPERSGLSVTEFEAPSGEVKFWVPSNLPAQNITVEAYLYNDTKTSSSLVATATIQVRYNVTTVPADLNFSYTQGSSEFVRGTVTDRNGNPVPNVSVMLKQGSETYSASGPTTTNGEFGILVYSWRTVGPLELYVGSLLHKTGRVGGISASLSVTPNNNVAHTISETTFAVQGSGFNSNGGYVTLTISRNSETITTVDPFYIDSSYFTKQFRWRPPAAGTYTLEATQGVYSATANITVANPSGYNFVNTEQLTNLRIGDASRNQLQIGKPSGTYLVLWDGTSVTDHFYYDVYVDGELKVEKKGYATIGIDVSQFGSKAIRIVAFRDTRPIGSNNPVYSYVHEGTFAAKVSGWNVTLSSSSLTVNETRDLTFVVKDENGTPMNNATIRFDRYELNPYNYNSQNGTYVFKDVRFSTAGPVSVIVKQGDMEKAQLTLNVVGQKVYQLTSSTSTLLQGKAQTVRFNLSKGNQALLPQVLEMEDSKGKITSIPFTIVSTSGSYAVIDAVITPELVGDLLIRARNFTGTECGEFKLNAMAPKLVLIDTQAENVTENIKTKVRFKVVDPRDNSTLQTNVNISADYAGITVYDAYDAQLWSNTLLGASEHTVSILATDAQYETASDKKADVAVVLKVDGVSIGSFPIKPATIESDPKMIVIGAPAPLTLTYKDANGKPIAGKMIQVQEGSTYVDVARTDSLGQVTYPAVQTYGNSIIFQAATDVSKQYVKGEVRFGYDSEAPKVTYDKESKTSKTTIVITDNVRITKLRINNEEIDLFAGKRYEHTLSLKPGLNKFRIEAQDNNYNYLDETIEINYVTGSQPPTSGESVKYTIGKTTYYVDGKAQQLEAAPFLRGDHTLVPVRALQSIGAIFAWDGSARTATFQLDGNVVKVTIGKSTAIVNGKATAMPVAAEIVKDRTMVPFRFVGQSLGLQVDYVAATKDIIITRAAKPQG